MEMKVCYDLDVRMLLRTYYVKNISTISLTESVIFIIFFFFNLKTNSFNKIPSHSENDILLKTNISKWIYWLVCIHASGEYRYPVFISAI